MINRQIFLLSICLRGRLNNYSLSNNRIIIESRATAIESIESTIAELGNIFQQLATMVAEQRETVQRIDANTDDIHTHVEGAQKELLKYYASISSNRWLMVKIFAVIIFFFLVFILVT
jgi:syntaxin 5